MVCLLGGHVARTEPAGPVPFGRAASGFDFARKDWCDVLTVLTVSALSTGKIVVVANEKVAEGEPDGAGSLADTAVDDHLVAGVQARVLLVGRADVDERPAEVVDDVLAEGNVAARGQRTSDIPPRRPSGDQPRSPHQRALPRASASPLVMPHASMSLP